jgi:hypothetical protein
MGLFPVKSSNDFDLRGFEDFAPPSSRSLTLALGTRRYVRKARLAVSSSSLRCGFAVVWLFRTVSSELQLNVAAES